MPKLIGPKETQTETGDGWRVSTLVDSSVTDAAMVARRWVFDPDAVGPDATQGEADQLLFVIRGRGSAVVDGNRLPLEPESMLWLEPGERYHFEAGPEGMEILQGYATGDAR